MSQNIIRSSTQLFIDANVDFHSKKLINLAIGVSISDGVNKGQMDSELLLKQIKNDQIEVSTNTNVLNSWHGQTILFTANCTITVPSTLSNSLMFPFRTLSGVTVTWVITSPFIWETTPNTTAEKTTGHFMRRGSTNTIFLDF